MEQNKEFTLFRHNSFGIFSGFLNMYLYELKQWFKWKKGLPLLLGWIVLVNGLLFVLYQFYLQFQLTGAAASDFLENFVPAMSVALTAFTITLGFAAPIGATSIMQNIIVDEKKTGTVGWLLSKPISRFSFIMAKLAAQSTVIITAMVLIPSFIAYFQFWSFFGKPSNLWLYFQAILVIIMNIMFYVSLTLMLGTLFMRRAVITAIPFILIFFVPLFLYYIPSTVYFMPWALVMPSTGNGGLYSIATAILTGGRLTNFYPLIWTPILSSIFIAVALWKFDQEEL